MGNGTKVYILGAGCSYDGDKGYPLAKDFAKGLAEFASSLEGDTTRFNIQMAAKRTAELLARCKTPTCHVSTIDELVSAIFCERCDAEVASVYSSQIGDEDTRRYLAVREAKVATAAWFLSLEGNAFLHEIARYKRFIQNILSVDTMSHLSCQERLRGSKARVLTFNYDRLFELAFNSGFAGRYEKNHDIYSRAVLNSGFISNDSIQENSFCFLKLHGSIGATCQDTAFGQEIYRYSRVSEWVGAKVNDTLFYPNSGKIWNSPSPLIAFPFEKGNIVSGHKTGFPFHEYIQRVWKHAEKEIQQASEITLIGYSLGELDRPYLRESFRAAQNCDRVTVQNFLGACEDIKQILQGEFGMRVPIEFNTTLF